MTTVTQMLYQCEPKWIVEMSYMVQTCHSRLHITTIRLGQTKKTKTDSFTWSKVHNKIVPEDKNTLWVECG